MAPSFCTIYPEAAYALKLCGRSLPIVLLESRESDLGSPYIQHACFWAGSSQKLFDLVLPILAGEPRVSGVLPPQSDAKNDAVIPHPSNGVVRF